MDIESKGPMSRSQKTSQVAATERWLNQLLQVSEVFPELRDLPDPDAIGREMATLLGVPPEMVRSEDEVLQIRKERAEQQAKMQQMQEAQMGGDAMKSMGEGMDAMQEAAE